MIDIPRPRSLGAWLLLLAFETGCQLALKRGSVDVAALPPGFSWITAVLMSPWLLCGLAFYLCSFLAWMSILKDVELSWAFPMTGTVYVSVLLGAHLLLGERIAMVQLAGVAAIVVGAGLLGPGGDTVAGMAESRT